MKSGFKSVSSPLEKILKKYNLQDIYFLQSLKTGWNEMDKTIAIHSEPLNYNSENKILTIKVKNETWKTEFKKNVSFLKSKIRVKFKNIDIEKIEII